MKFADKLDMIEEDEFTVTDPMVTLPLSVLSKLQADAEYYGQRSDSYVAIRNNLVKEVMRLREEIKTLKTDSGSAHDVKPSTNTPRLGGYYKDYAGSLYVIISIYVHNDPAHKYPVYAMRLKDSEFGSFTMEGLTIKCDSIYDLDLSREYNYIGEEL